MQITRSQLIEATEQTIAEARDRARRCSTPARNVSISDDLKHELMNVALTADSISWNWWLPSRECGCLIGTYRHRLGLDAEPCDFDDDLIQRSIGSLFPGVVCEILHVGAWTVLDVVPDPVPAELALA